MSFSKYISDLSLNHQSKFEYLAQAALEYYYLIPYPGSLDKRPNGVNRLHHGALHACMVARHVDLFLALYQKYAQLCPLLQSNPYA